MFLKSIPKCLDEVDGDVAQQGPASTRPVKGKPVAQGQGLGSDRRSHSGTKARLLHPALLPEQVKEKKTQLGYARVHVTACCEVA